MRIIVFRELFLVLSAVNVARASAVKRLFSFHLVYSSLACNNAGKFRPLWVAITVSEFILRVSSTFYFYTDTLIFSSMARVKAGLISFSLARSLQHHAMPMFAYVLRLSKELSS